MKTKKIKINHRDLIALMGHAKTYLLAQPNVAYIDGSHRPLTEGEKLALAYMGAAFMVAGGKGVDTSHIVIEYDDSMHDPV